MSFKDGFEERKCEICGNKFIEYPQHVYKIARARNKNKIVSLCSWHCLQEARKNTKKYANPKKHITK